MRNTYPENNSPRILAEYVREGDGYCWSEHQPVPEEEYLGPYGIFSSTLRLLECGLVRGRTMIKIVYP